MKTTIVSILTFLTICVLVYIYFSVFLLLFVSERGIEKYYTLVIVGLLAIPVIAATATWWLSRTRSLPYQRELTAEEEEQANNTASPKDRVMAGMIDSFIVLGLIAVIAKVLPSVYADADSFLMVIVSLVGLIYEPLCVSILRGTVGHKLKGLKVERTNGYRLNFLLALMRFLVKTFLGVYSFLLMMGPRRQAIHDRISQSVVLYS